MKDLCHRHLAAGLGQRAHEFFLRLLCAHLCGFIRDLLQVIRHLLLVEIQRARREIHHRGMSLQQLDLLRRALRCDSPIRCAQRLAQRLLPLRQFQLQDLADELLLFLEPFRIQLLRFEAPVGTVASNINCYTK